MAQQPQNWKRWLVLTSIAVEMGVIIYASNQLGRWLDGMYFPGEKTLAVVFTLAGVAVAMLLVMNKTKRLNT